MFSFFMNKNGFYKNILGFKMLQQSKITGTCVVQPPQQGRVLSSVVWAFVFSLVLGKKFRLFSSGKTFELLAHNFK